MRFEARDLNAAEYTTATPSWSSSRSQEGGVGRQARTHPVVELPIPGYALRDTWHGVSLRAARGGGDGVCHERQVSRAGGTRGRAALQKARAARPAVPAYRGSSRPRASGRPGTPPRTTSRRGTCRCRARRTGWPQTHPVAWEGCGVRALRHTPTAWAVGGASSQVS